MAEPIVSEKEFGVVHTSVSHGVQYNDVATSLTSDEKHYILVRLGHEGLDDMNDIPLDAVYMFTKIETLSETESVAILKDALVEHVTDVNFPLEDYELIERLLEEKETSEVGNIEVLDNISEKRSDEKSKRDYSAEAIASDLTENQEKATYSDGPLELGWGIKVRTEAALIAFHSPYPEVRSVTDPYDDPDIPVETIRAYFLALIWTIIGAGVNEFFRNRQPAISLPSSVIQMLLYPCGKVVERLPDWGFTIRGTRHSLNPGPWTYKEQMFATVVFNVGIGTAYVSYNIYVQKLPMYYNNDWISFGYQVLLIFSTQFMGFGFAGVMRKICIYPIQAVWPTILPTLALNRALLKGEVSETINGWKISRYRFFFIAFIGSFLYFWVPSYLFEAMSYFNWMTWIKPDNFNLAAITGSLYGLGLNPIPTFDWNMIDFNAALVMPFYSQLNQYIGSLLAFFCIIGVFWSNYKWTAYLPINSNALFTNQGKTYAVTQILTDNLLDIEKYQEYGAPYYSAANLVVYGAFFALYPFYIVYVFLTEWKSMKYAGKHIYSIFRHWKKSNFSGLKDPHSRMMSRYKEVPDYFFLIILVIAIVFAILCVQIYRDLLTPVWLIFVVVGINFVFLIPITAVYSVTGFSFGLNVLVELIVGYILPGNGQALMFLKALGYNIDGQAQNYITDQKMAHYAKVPPMAIFRGQMIATFLQCFVSLGVMNWSISNIEGVCELGQVNKFTCPGNRTYYSASVFWGVIAPKRVFGGLYPILEYCFLMGALLPIPCVLFKWYGPKKIAKYFQPTLIIGGFLVYAPYNLSYITSGLYVSIVFMYYIKNRYLSWWEKYNYILSAGLNAGVAFSGIIIFFAVQYHPKYIDWWGNNVPYMGIEGGVGQRALLDPADAPDGYFGIRRGEFPV